MVTINIYLHHNSLQNGHTYLTLFLFANSVRQSKSPFCTHPYLTYFNSASPEIQTTWDVAIYCPEINLSLELSPFFDVELDIPK